MSRVSDMLLEVEDFVYSFYDREGQLTESYPNIVLKAREKYGITFGEYAEDVLMGDVYPTEPNYMPEEIEYRKALTIQFNDEIPF